jgi:hypothetical protein
MKGHGWWMVIGCVLPLLLIFAAPLFGISGDWGLFLFIGLMFVCHLGMMGGHGGHGGRHPNHKQSNQEDDSHETTEH